MLFIIGFLVGTFTGIILMCIVQINRVNRIGNEVEKILTEQKKQNQKN